MTDLLLDRNSLMFDLLEPDQCENFWPTINRGGRTTISSCSAW